MKKYKWTTPEKAFIYRWWKKEEKKEEFEKYGDVAVMEKFDELKLEEKDDDALILLITKDDLHINVGPCEAQLCDCFVIDKKKKYCFYDDMSNLKRSYDFKERKNGTN